MNFFKNLYSALLKLYALYLVLLSLVSLSLFVFNWMDQPFDLIILLALLPPVILYFNVLLIKSFQTMRDIDCEHVIIHLFILFVSIAPFFTSLKKDTGFICRPETRLAAVIFFGTGFVISCIAMMKNSLSKKN
ncbi:MAG: hypothetical protein JW774_05565 [Candidatus Aureabacteria bacterium]|nr:hypothetical protein [Candidatus Auribacterota bacterium]